MRTGSLVATALLLAASTLTVHAEPITYTESGLLSGTLGRNYFLDALVTITATGNTNSVVNDGGGTYSIVLPAELTVAGIGSTTFKDTMDFSVNQTNHLAGVGDVTQNAELLSTAVRGSAFGNYNLQSSIGPINGEAIYSSDVFARTGLGLFNIEGDDGSTFQAVASSPAVPEPSSLVLLATGLLGAAGATRRRFLRS